MLTVNSHVTLSSVEGSCRALVDDRTIVKKVDNRRVVTVLFCRHREHSVAICSRCKEIHMRPHSIVFVN